MGSSVTSQPGEVPRHTADAVDEVMRRVRLVPDRYREYTESTVDVHRVHRIGSSLLARLLDLGLPHQGTGEDRRFDRWDLANVGVSLKLPCPRYLAMRWWSKAMSELRPGASVGYTLELSASCPAPGHAGPCDFHLSPLVRRAAHIDEVRPGTYTAAFSLPSEVRCLPAWFGQLIEQIRPIRFHLLPVTLSQELAFLADTNLGDCRTVTLYLNRLGRQWGLPVRPALGYFVAPPYATAHAWIEVETDGEWLPADPFLLSALIRWGIVDPERWPVDRSPQGVLWRLHRRNFEMLLHGDVSIYPTVAMTGRRLAGTPASDR